MQMTITESRQSLGITDPLDTFLDKDRSHIERFGIAMAVGIPAEHLDGLIEGCHSKSQQKVLQSRLNLHLTLNGAGKKVKESLVDAVRNTLDNGDPEAFTAALRAMTGK